MSNYRDGKNFRPIDHTAYAGDRPFDQYTLGVLQNNLKHAAKRGSQCCIGLTDAGDDITNETAAARHYYSSIKASQVASGFRAIYLIPYFFQPGLKSIELDLFYRISRFDVDDDRLLPSNPLQMKVGVRAIAAGIQPEDDETLQDYKLTSEISGSNESAVAHWTYDTISFDFERNLSQSGSWGLLAVEMASNGEQKVEVKSGTESQTANTKRTDQKVYGDEYGNMGGMYAEVWMQDTPDVKVSAQPLGFPPFGGNTQPQFTNFLTEHTHNALQGPGDSTFEWRQYAIPYMNIRALTVREEFYTPDNITVDQYRSETPPTSSKMRRWPQLAQELYQRSELIFADPTYRHSPGFTGQNRELERMVSTPHEPCEIVFRAVLVYTAETEVGESFDTGGSGWSEIARQSPSADTTITLELWDAAGNKIDSRDSVERNVFYGEDVSGEIPFLARLGRENSGLVIGDSRDDRDVQYLNIDNGKFLDQGGASSNPSNLDIREIRIQLDPADYDFRAGLRFGLNFSTPDNISRPETGTFSDLTSDQLHQHLLGYSIWSMPR